MVQFEILYDGCIIYSKMSSPRGADNGLISIFYLGFALSETQLLLIIAANLSQLQSLFFFISYFTLSILSSI